MKQNRIENFDVHKNTTRKSKKNAQENSKWLKIRQFLVGEHFFALKAINLLTFGGNFQKADFI